MQHKFLKLAGVKNEKEFYKKFPTEEAFFKAFPEAIPTVDEFGDGGSIHIKPENRGKFNATKERTGKTTEELTHSKNPLTRKRAIFAQNAAKWKHADGGEISPIEEQPEGNYLYGPANSVIGIYNNKGEFSPYNMPEQQGKVNKADLEMLNNPEAMKKYVQGKGLKMGKGGKVSASKALEILHDGTAHGHKLTEKQRKFFGVMSNKKGEYGMSLEDPIKPILPQGDSRFSTATNVDIWGNPAPLNGAVKPPTYASIFPIQNTPPNNLIGDNPAWTNYPPLGATPVIPSNPKAPKMSPNPDYIPNKGEGQLNRGQSPNLTPGQQTYDKSAVKPNFQMPEGKGAEGSGGQALLAGLMAFDALLPKEKIRRRYLRPEDLPSYNEHPYGTGSQAINKNGGKIKGEKAFWGAIIGAVAGKASDKASTDKKNLFNNVQEGLAPLMGISGQAQQEADRLNSLYLQGDVQNLNNLQTTRPQYYEYGGDIKYGQGGELQTYNGGNTFLASYNPFDGGTFQFDGDSHEKGGIDISYKGSPAEVEGGETAFKDREGDLKIMGNLKVPGTNMKYKALSKNLAEKEKKAQRYVDKGTRLLNIASPDDPYELLAFNAGKAMTIGGLMKQKQLSELKQHLGDMQEAHLETVKEKRSDKAEDGLTIFPAQDPPKKWKYQKTNVDKLDKSIKEFADMLASKGVEGYSGERGGYRAGAMTASGRKSRHASNQALDIIPVKGEDAYDAIIKDPELVSYLMKNGLTVINEYDPATAKQTNATAGHLHIGRDKGTKVADKFRNDVAALYPDLYKPINGKYKTPIINAALIGDAGTENVPGFINKPYNIPKVDYTPKPRDIQTVQGNTTLIDIKQPTPIKKPSNARGLSPLQLLGEGYALATNRAEPVKAQLYYPELFQPYQVSFQDRLNENNAAFNSVEKQLAYDPTSLATLAGQKYSANSSVLAEEFRTNQAIANDITNKNVSLLNEAKKTNLGILDQQFVRQETAKSKTRDTTQMALNSISSKMLQKEASNNMLKVYENLYPNYAFDKRTGKAEYYGPAAEEQIDWSGIQPSGNQPSRSKVETKTGNTKTTQYYDNPTEEFMKSLKLQEKKMNMFPKSLNYYWKNSQ